NLRVPAHDRPTPRLLQTVAVASSDGIAHRDPQQLLPLEPADSLQDPQPQPCPRSLMKWSASEMEAHNTNHFCNAKSKSNGGVGKGHDSCKNREPCHVMEIWNLGEHYLNDPKHQHVEAISKRARSTASLCMVTV
ncbi:hypothetical protein MUK42_19783, partial [Musa troglodytarum]